MRLTSSLVLSLSLLAGACGSSQPRHRTVAQVAEGGLVVAGIVLLSGVGSPADCMNELPGVPNTACESNASVFGNVGLGLILAGLLGFAVTVATAPEDDAETTPVMPPAPL